MLIICFSVIVYVLVEHVLVSTWSGRLWNRLVNTGVEAAADGNVVGGVGHLTTLISELLLSSPLGSSIGKPNLRNRKEKDIRCYKVEGGFTFLLPTEY